jgi:hypothetical protein
MPVVKLTEMIQLQTYRYMNGGLSLHLFVPRLMTGTGVHGSVRLSAQDIDRTTSSEADKTMCHPTLSM